MYADSLKQERIKLDEEGIPSEESAKVSHISRVIDINKKLELLKRELKEMKEKEQKRIFHEYTNRKHGVHHNAPLKTVLEALFGTEILGKEFATKKFGPASKNSYNSLH